MGNPKNITESTLTRLSQHWNKSLEDTKKELLNLLDTHDKRLEEDQHLKTMFSEAAKSWGQTLEEAKKNTRELLKSQIKN